MERNAEDRQSEREAQIGPLMALLRDNSKDVPARGEFAPRYRAITGLVKLGGAAVDPLCQALQDPDAYTRRFAAEALSRIGDTRAVAPLLIALHESEVYVQRYVARALAVLGDARAVEPLCTALGNPDVAREVLFALHAVLKRTASTVSIPDLRRVAHLMDDGHAVVEAPDTDGGYLSWERVDQWLDYRPIKQLASEELGRRGQVV